MKYGIISRYKITAEITGYDRMLEIIKAIKKGNLNYIKNLLNSDTSWLDNFLKDYNGQKIFPIHCAVEHGQLAIIELMLGKKADLLNQKDAFEQTCIHFATYHGHLHVVKYLLDQGASLSIPTNAPDLDCHGLFPIHWAVSAGHIEILNLLIDNENANLNARIGKLQYHLIHIASLRGYTEIVEILLKKDPGLLNIMDAQGQTPVIWAACCGHKELVNYLVNMGADLTLATNNINSYDYGYSPIHWATNKGYKDIVELLIERGVEINTRVGKLQYHLIHMASIKGHIEIVEVLLKKDPGLLNIIDAQGQTPVILATSCGHKELVNYLVNMGADLTLATNDINSDDYGYSPIHLATNKGYKDIVELLIERGVEINTRVGKLQYHLIHIASIKGHIEIVKFLLNKDPELLNLMDGCGRTPVFLAAAGVHTNLVAYLILMNPNKDIPIMEDENFADANLLISKIAKSPNIKEISFVQSGIQALDLMISEPALANIFLRDNRIFSLIGEQYCNITQESIDWYKTSGRRPSWFASINRYNETSSLFKPVKQLGAGSYGTVRLFETDDGKEKIAVKSLKNNIINCSNEDELNLTNSLNREAEFNRLAYPDDKLTKTFAIRYANDNKEIYTNRYIMPYVKGETASKIIPTTRCPILLAKITLEIVKELHRIHGLRIVHGDLNDNNIMIYLDKTMTPSIRLLDFGCSYFIDDYDANIWDPKNIGRWLAPEICTGSKEVVKPHYNQDVYALGYLLKATLNKNPSFQELKRLFPSINKFILSAMSIKPSSRPFLERFQEELSEELKIINESKIENDTTITPKY